MAIDLLKLLKLGICENCPDSRKLKKDNELMCCWEQEDGDKPIPCARVKDCGSWPDIITDLESLSLVSEKS